MDSTARFVPFGTYNCCPTWRIDFKDKLLTLAKLARGHYMFEKFDIGCHQAVHNNYFLSY